MADDGAIADSATPRPLSWPRWLGRISMRWLLGLAVALILIAGAAALLLESSIGRRFVTDRIENVSPESGLKIRVGRIEGSLFSNAVLRDVRVYDPQGLFLEVPEARLDWQPFDYLWRNRLTIHDLDVDRARWLRMPHLNKTADDKPILPDFDILVERLRIGRLSIAQGIAGPARTATATGRADIRSGTAIVALDARVIDGGSAGAGAGSGDRIKLDLVAVPDAQQFDVDADIVAPRGGVLAALTGIDRGVSGVIRGSGNWANWRGSLLADSEGASLARLTLSARDGRYGASGRVWPGVIAGGALARLSADGVAVDADGRFANRRWDGRFSAVTDAVQFDATGGADLGQNRFSAMRVDGWVRQPKLLLDRLDGQAVQVALLLDGAFAAPRFEYRLTAPWIAYGTTRLTGVEAVGSGLASRNTMQIPLRLRVATVTGIGTLAQGLVRNLSADGVIAWRDGLLSSDGITVRSAGLNGRVVLRADTGSGAATVGFDGALPGFEVAGLGRVDLLANISARRGAGGGAGSGALMIDGTARATMRRLDNEFLRTLTGGLPVVTSGIAIGPDGVVRFSNLRVTSPLLTLTGAGIRRADGTFQLSGRGAHRRYGPVVVSLAGPIDRPRTTVRLANPLPAAQLSDVELQLIPSATGFAFTSTGGSMLGPYQAAGQINLPRGRGAVIDIQRLAVGGTVARGQLVVAQGGLAGQLLVGGGGLDGSIILSVPGGIQRVVARLTARDARFSGPPPISIARGQLSLTMLLDPRGTDVDATFEGTGLRRGTLSIARIAGNARLVDGIGTVRGSMAGARGRDFSARFLVDVARDRYTVRGDGTLARQPIRLTRAAQLRRDGSGWRLDRAELTYAGGRAQLSGLFGGSALEVESDLENIPLSLLELGWPDLGLGGRASGHLVYRDSGSTPSGDAQLRLRGFTRAGLTDNSAPIDIALNAGLTANSAAMRAVVERGGVVIGRIQGRTSPLPAGPDIIARITHAPLLAQLRYSGEAGTLWRLTGIENFTLSGPVTVAADATGTLADPSIRGVVRTSNARFESFVTGTVVTGISANGRFDGSRLQLRNISGQTAGGGTVTGEGDFDLAAARGFAMDMRINAANALLIDRDDLVARVSGLTRLQSDGAGGVISGNLTLDSGRFQLGRATAIDALPVIRVVEVNAPADRPTPRASFAPWRLALNVRGRSRFIVTGLGLDSEWSTNVAVRGDATNFAITGAAQLVRGDYMFAGRRFALESGTIRFTGSTPVDPVLDIVAVDDIAGIDASIRVRGTGLHPEITFASVPALPEDELLSRILFGASITDISVAEAAQLGVALASLRDGGGGLDPINAIRRATGLDRLRILPANSEIGSGTSLAAGKYLTRRVFVEIVTDGQGYSATRVEYQITRWLALLGSISTLGQESINVRVKRDY